MRTMLAALLTLALMPVAYAAPDQPLSSRMDVYRIEVDADGRETTETAEEILPGELLEYRLSYENVSDAPLRALIFDSYYDKSVGLKWRVGPRLVVKVPAVGQIGIKLENGHHVVWVKLIDKIDGKPGHLCNLAICVECRARDGRVVTAVLAAAQRVK